MSAPKLILRADGSSQLGLGHIVRCLSLAEDACELGFQPILVTRDSERGALDPWTSSTFDTQLLPKETGIEEDAKRTRELVERAGAKGVVTDLVNSEYGDRPEALRSFHRTISDATLTAAFGDDRLRRLGSDISIVPYVHSPSGGWNGKARLLAGPDYFVIRPELRRIGSDPSIPHRARNLFVTIGGSDPCGITLDVLDGLERLDLRSLDARVLLGPAYTPKLRRRAREQAEKMDGEVAIVEEDGAMVQELDRADLVVTGGGLTKYEAAYLGVPTLLIPRPETDPSINEAFSNTGSARLLPAVDELDPSRIALQLRELIEDWEARKEMAVNGQALVDGDGSHRILSVLREEIETDA